MASTGKSKRNAVVHDNFLEALRDLGKGVVDEVKTQAKQIVASDLPESFGISGSGVLNPNESVSLSQLQSAESRGEQQAESRFRQQLAELQRQQEAFASRQTAEIRQQILALKQEIQTFAKSAGEFAQEVQKATAQIPSRPGIYHKNFFIHLREVIMTLRKRVESSRNWLATANARAGKRGFYWGQISKSGTKYMLSSERYMVMSTG